MFVLKLYTNILSASHYITNLTKFHSDPQFIELLNAREKFNNNDQFSSIITHSDFNKKIPKDGKVPKKKKTKYTTINVYMVQKPWKEMRRNNWSHHHQTRKQEKIEEST